MKKINLGLSLSCLVFLIACGSTDRKPWQQQMQEASRILSELMPKLVLGQWSSSEKEKTDLKALTLQLSGISHGINSDTAVPSLDPSLKFISREFKKELTQAEYNMEQNKWVQARDQVYRATQYCIACHTMTTAGSSSYSLDLKPQLKGLSHYEKAIYFTAVRQFEEALVQYELALNNKEWAAENPKLWGQGILNIMSIAGRIKRDPDLILEMASRFFDTEAYPAELAVAAKTWREDAKNWRETKTARITLKITNLYMRKANQHEKKVRHSGLILYLRASSNLNELLRMGAIADHRLQSAYYIAGLLAEALCDSSFTGFAEDYYKLCLEKSETTKASTYCKKALNRLNKKRRQ